MTGRGKNSEVFREKSLERASSPENLDSYIKSTTPSLWLLMASVTVILTGIIVWSVFGKLDSTSPIGCKVDEDGVMTAYITEKDYAKIKDCSYIKVEDKAFSLVKDSIAGPMLEGDGSDSFLVQAAGIEAGSWYYTVTCQTDLSPGKYKASAVYEQISPITFIMN